MKKFEFTEGNPQENYKDYSQQLVNDFAAALGTEATVDTRVHKHCLISSVSGRSFDELAFTINLPQGPTKYNAQVALQNFISFNNPEHQKLYDTYALTYKQLTNQYREAEHEFFIKCEEAKALETKRVQAEQQYQRAKEKALSSFEEHTKRSLNRDGQSDEFFYALGWLAKHIGTISATIPDYLDSAFQKYFGTDAVHTIVDAKRRTVNGYAMQWSWSFKASVVKVDSIPCCLITYFNDSCKAITNTSFIWDLISTWGFKFGRKQDINQIKSNIPDEALTEFEAGFAS